ncbi:AraC family transcriptional regulator [Aquimarina sp. ERC-38]|uniref:helix-turn-helix domain-containing protein n=1 Tax=Aquimarina sp. ERC-38 TaxID=2949996 RepID=UPI002246C05D|nr:AraC family transcriptional regulator [Aquimarina sp. ERC-38]UZO79587.1 AraC family transcriptional regulator [Aquimarina sp. ERC-38]
MNTLARNTDRNELNSIKNSIPGTIRDTCNSTQFIIDQAYGKGEITQIEIAKGIQVYSFNLTANRAMAINLDFIPSHTLQFIFGIKGTFLYNYSGNTEPVMQQVDTLQTAVSYSSNSALTELKITAQTQVQLSIITIDLHTNTSAFKSEYTLANNSELKSIVSEIEGKDYYFYKGSMDLIIAEKFKSIEAIYMDSNNITHSLSSKGAYFIILAKEIQKFSKEINQIQTPGSLLKEDMKNIIAVTDCIKKNPEKDYLIVKVSRETGLSPAKLQEGIKSLYDVTFSHFVRDCRLDKAEDLIKTTDLTISEIVYTIGLTSRSYFCKVFKNKYKTSPTNYRNKTKLTQLNYS